MPRSRSVFDHATLSTLAEFTPPLGSENLHGSSHPFARVLRDSDVEESGGIFQLRLGFDVVVSTHLDADDACATLSGSLPMALLQPIAPYVLEHRSPSEEAPADEPPQEHGRETAELLGLRRREALPQLRRALRAVRLGELRVLRLGGTTRRIVRREERGERGRKRGRHGKCCFKITNEDSDSQQLLERGRLPRHATPTSSAWPFITFIR